MATFLNSLTKRKSQQRASEEFSRIASDIQAIKLERQQLENLGKTDVANINQATELGVQRLENKGYMDVTKTREAGDTLRRQMAEAGETGRTNIRQAESGRQFDLGHALDVAEEARKAKGFKFKYGLAEQLAPFNVEATRSGYEADTLEAQQRAEEAYQSLDLSKREAADRRKRRVAQDVEGRSIIIEPDQTKRRIGGGAGMTEDDFSYLDEYFSNFGGF